MHNDARSFQLALGKYADGIPAKVSAMVKKVTFELLRMIVVRTPVDTGRAAGSWMVAAGGVDGFVLPDSASLSKDEAVSRAMMAVNKINFSDLNTVYWIFNNLPYIASLEFGLYPKSPKRGSRQPDGQYVIKTVDGYSKQAPAGMVRISIAEIEVKISAL
jgi:hypothetical protein